jgi:hypothetical protein
LIWGKVALVSTPLHITKACSEIFSIRFIRYIIFLSSAKVAPLSHIPLMHRHIFAITTAVTMIHVSDSLTYKMLPHAISTLPLHPQYSLYTKVSQTNAALNAYTHFHFSVIFYKSQLLYLPELFPSGQ